MSRSLVIHSTRFLSITEGEYDNPDRDSETVRLDGCSIETPAIVAIRELRERGLTCPSSSEFHPGVWYTMPDGSEVIDYGTGEREERTGHVQGFTDDEQRHIYDGVRYDPPSMPDEFLTQYLETALWSSTDNSDDTGGAPLDNNYGVDDIAPESLASAREDCESFWASHWPDIQSHPSRAGHDFWLTRNRHGAGFWDGDWPSDVGTRLTESSHCFGSVDLYIGDDGKVYGS